MYSDNVTCMSLASMAIIGSVFLSLENLSLTLNKAFLYQWSSIVPPPTFLADPEVEKTKCTEEMEPVALHYEISDTTPYVSETKEEKVMLSQSEPELNLIWNLNPNLNLNLNLNLKFTQTHPEEL